MDDHKAKVAEIRAVILSEAGTEVERMLAAARDAAREAVERARLEADREAETQFQEAQARTEALCRNRAAAAAAEARSRVLAARTAILDEATAAAAEQLARARSRPEYTDELRALLVEAALTLAPSTDLEVLIDERDAAIVTEDFLGSVEIILTFSHDLGTKLRLASERIETSGGVVVRARGSNLRCDNTFDERLRAARPELWRLVVQEVFEP